MLLFITAGCEQLRALAAPKDAPVASAPAVEAAKPPQEASTAAPVADPTVRYALPFAWQTSPTEPLARARQLLGEALVANDAFVALGKSRPAPFSDAEAPRATVVACAESRVQASAWDATPDNDSFTVRNIGNQLSTALGSVEYGVVALGTPVLLIAGHTGCSAVKARLDHEELGTVIGRELEGMQLPPPRAGASPDQALTEAVIANVNTQVAAAVRHFESRVQSGDLTVVGAVHDLRNALGRGYGRMHVINVNTNLEPARIEAFVRAVREAPAASARGKTQHASAVSSDERIRAIIERTARALPRPRTKGAAAREAPGHTQTSGAAAEHTSAVQSSHAASAHGGKTTAAPPRHEARPSAARAAAAH